MKITLSVIILVCCFQDIVFAETEKQRVIMCFPRVPVIDLAKASEIAVTKATQIFNGAEAFIDSANLIYTENGYIWSIGFRRAEYESGQFVVKVSMNGAADVSITKDG